MKTKWKVEVVEIATGKVLNQMIVHYLSSVINWFGQDYYSVVIYRIPE